MKKFRFYLALWCAKLSVIALRLTGHKGTNFPGRVVLKICPDFLRQAGTPGKVLGITGTNGKTTVCNLMISMLEKDGKRVLDNNLGSNTITGLCTSFIRDMRLSGKFRSDVAVLEIDERSSRVVFPEMAPDFLLINNLTRDSIMRNGHPEYISRILTGSMPAKTHLILNGDDLIASGVAPVNERTYFGIESLKGDVKECINLVNDLQICPKCHNLLEYTNRRYHHIGRAFCPVCGFKSPKCDYLGRDADYDSMTIEITHGEGSRRYRMLNDSVFNIYNVVAVVAFMGELGYDPDRIEELLESVEIVESRFNVEEKGGFRIVRQMSKDRNALGSSRAFDYVSGLPGDKELILMMNNLSDAAVWSENVCWLYDCDFEFLNRDNILNIVVTGPRAKDYYLRLKMAGIDDDRISFVHDELDSPGALRFYEGESIYVLYGTDSIELAEKVAEKVKQKIEERSRD